MNYMEREKKSGIQRLIDVRENIDQRASLILTYHAALECETDRLLAKLLPRANKLRGLGFGQKISVLDAAWPGQPALAEVLFSALVQFNDLRNAVAHGDSKREVDRIISKIERHLGSNLPTGDDENVVIRISSYLFGAINGTYASVSEPITKEPSGQK